MIILEYIILYYMPLIKCCMNVAFENDWCSLQFFIAFGGKIDLQACLHTDADICDIAYGKVEA